MAKEKAKLWNVLAVECKKTYVTDYKKQIGEKVINAKNVSEAIEKAREKKGVFRVQNIVRVELIATES